MKMRAKLMNELAKSDLDCTYWPDPVLRELTDIIFRTLRDPTDEELLAPGKPYRVSKAIDVPESEGINLRRKAWNTILKHMENH